MLTEVPDNLSINSDFSHLRKEYSLNSLDKRNTASDPMDQFRLWFGQAISAGVDEPNAMTLATVSSDHIPSARIVLLKGIEQEGFVFYSNFNSRKGIHLLQNPSAALVFFWPALERQVRIEGHVVLIDEYKASLYFQERPRESQVSAIISPQSQSVPSRKYLEQLREYFLTSNKEDQLKRPANWGGYVVLPKRIEFWQGRKSRLHDRIQYLLVEGKWIKERLAP
jgi:pyridoxamine 5'-phosphate oxidase